MHLDQIRGFRAGAGSVFEHTVDQATGGLGGAGLFGSSGQDGIVGPYGLGQDQGRGGQQGAGTDQKGHGEVA